MAATTEDLPGASASTSTASVVASTRSRSQFSRSPSVHSHLAVRSPSASGPRARGIFKQLSQELPSLIHTRSIQRATPQTPTEESLLPAGSSPEESVFSSEYASERPSTHEDMDVGDSAIEMVDQPKSSSASKFYGSLRARLRSRSPSASAQQRNVLKRRSRSAEVEPASQRAASHARNPSYGEVEDRLSRVDDGDLRPRLSTIPSSRASESIAERRESRPITRSPSRPLSNTNDAHDQRHSQITAEVSVLQPAAQAGPSTERPHTPIQQPVAKSKRRSFFGLLASPRRASFRSPSRPTSPISPRMTRHHDREYTSAPSSRPSVDLTTAPSAAISPPPSSSDPNLHASNHDRTPRPSRRTKLAHTKLDFWFHPRFFSSSNSNAESSNTTARRGPRFAMGGASFLMATAGSVQRPTPSPAAPETSASEMPDSGASEAYTDFDESPGLEAEETFADADVYLEHSSSTHASSPSANRKVTIMPQRTSPLSPMAESSANIPGINLVLPTPPRDRHMIATQDTRRNHSVTQRTSVLNPGAPPSRGLVDSQHHPSKETPAPLGRGFFDSHRPPRSSQAPRERVGKDKERKLSPSRVGSPVMMSSTVSVNNHGERNLKRSSSHSRGPGEDRNASYAHLPPGTRTRTILHVGGNDHRAAVVVPTSPSVHRKHSSFDFERSGGGRKVVFQEHSEGEPSESGHAVGVVRAGVKDKASSTVHSRKSEGVPRTSKQQALLRSNSDRISPNARERAVSPNSTADQSRAQSSSWGRSSSKTRGPLLLPAFSFEPAAPAVSGPKPLSSRKGPADVAASKKAKVASIEEEEPEGAGSKRRAKGRSLDLPLGLAWAPSRMRESTIMPLGIGVGRRWKGGEVDNRVEDNRTDELEDESSSAMPHLSSNTSRRYVQRSPAPPSSSNPRTAAAGRKVDLPLSLSWAPNKVREEAMLPIGVGRTRWNSTAPAKTGVDEQGRRLH